jgi:hypothetical protein
MIDDICHSLNASDVPSFDPDSALQAKVQVPYRASGKAQAAAHTDALRNGTI